MNNTARRVAVQACVGTLVAAAPLTMAGAAQAAVRAPFVVAHTSDLRVQPGQQFVVGGRMTTANESRPLRGATIRVQSLPKGANPDMNGRGRFGSRL